MEDDSADKGSTSGSQSVSGYTFRWSGGSGRVVITCTSVEERDGQTYATINFSGVSGRASHYDAVQVNGTIYSGSNTFTIPVTLNGNTVIQARTTAMSQAHWITYTLYIGKAGSGDNGIISQIRHIREEIRINFNIFRNHIFKEEHHHG